ncbi:MAG: farnesyl diphosphate synthase [Rhodospirillaceae bacterium]|nr:MAG: farnesyl diphosphate synthase [Rhodospirillaceae bacterium]
MSGFAKAMAEIAAQVNDTLEQLLPIAETPEGRLFEAMRYAALAGGKRLRPFLVVVTAGMFRVAESSALRAAAAVEMLHTYTLVHDDLPAMDNDDLRRGVPTCHRRFDEATAILAGDALLTRSFEVLADPDTHSGQMIDLLAETMPMDMIAVTRLQQLKTGRLIGFSCEAGAILGKAPRPLRMHLLAYAHDLGLAFQIRDDVLDLEGNVDEMGKAVRKDDSHGKVTFVSLLGLERARAQAAILVDQAIAHLNAFDGEAELLRQVARFVVERRN